MGAAESKVGADGCYEHSQGKPRKKSMEFRAPLQLYTQSDDKKATPASTTAPELPQQLVYKTTSLPRVSFANDAGTIFLRQLQVLDRDVGPYQEAILDTICSVLEADSACVALTDFPEKIYFWSGRGICTPGTYAAWAKSFMAISLTATNNTVTIIEDTAEDARVKCCPCVKGKDAIRSFLAAPLVATNGIRVGALCAFRRQAGGTDAASVAVLGRLAELTMREIEAPWAERHRAVRNLQRGLPAYSTATMLVDASQRGWKLLHLNANASQVTGVSLHMASASTLWALFKAADAEHPCNDYCQMVEQRHNFTIQGITRRGSSIHTEFVMHCSPPTDALDEHAVPLGIPSCATLEESSTHRYLFIKVLTAAEAAAAPPSLRSACMPSSVPSGLQDLQMEHLLGKGPYGRTYRGTYKGSPVAVKIVTHGKRHLRTKNGQPLMAVISERLAQPDTPLVRTITHACFYGSVRVAASKEKHGKGAECTFCKSGGTLSKACSCEDVAAEMLCDMSNSACSMQDAADAGSMFETWLVNEFCELGSLQTAIERGEFQHSNGRVREDAILAAADSVASGMQLLHKHGVQHGDLSASAVLLTACKDAPRGFRAKISDFGLQRKLDINGFATPEKYPFLAHLAPEVLLKGKMSKAADVYAFGVLLWEMAAGARMYGGIGWSQAMAAITMRHARPSLPRSRATPHGIESLARMCMTPDADARPSFDEVVGIVRAMRTSFDASNEAAGASRCANSKQPQDAPRQSSKAKPAKEHSSAALLKAVGARAEGAGERTSCSSDGSAGGAQDGAKEAMQQLLPLGKGPPGRSVDPAARDEWARVSGGASKLPSMGSADGGSGSGGGFGNLAGARVAARRSVNIRRSICSRGQRTGAAERIAACSGTGTTGGGGNSSRHSLSIPAHARALSGDASPRESGGGGLQSQGSAKFGFPDSLHKDSPPPLPRGQQQPAGAFPPPEQQKRLPSSAPGKLRRVSMTCERPATQADFSKGLMALQSALFQSTGPAPALPGTKPSTSAEPPPPSHCAPPAKSRGADTNDIFCRGGPALDRASLRPVRISMG